MNHGTLGFIFPETAASGDPSPISSVLPGLYQVLCELRLSQTITNIGNFAIESCMSFRANSGASQWFLYCHHRVCILPRQTSCYTGDYGKTKHESDHSQSSIIAYMVINSNNLGKRWLIESGLGDVFSVRLLEILRERTVLHYMLTFSFTHMRMKFWTI